MNASNTPPASQPTPEATRLGSTLSPARRLLITAGPTQEPIDAVRYIGNRSSGRLGIAIADVAAQRMRNGQPVWHATLLLGPTALTPTDPRVCTHRFRTTAELAKLLAEHAPHCDVLVMAAAVADYTVEGAGNHKLKRGKDPITLTLVPTPDLLAGVAAEKRPGQLFVGFALEPEDRLLVSAREKLRRKGVDLLIANPLETMDAPTIRATLVSAKGDTPLTETDEPITKDEFAELLLDKLETRVF